MAVSARSAKHLSYWSPVKARGVPALCTLTQLVPIYCLARRCSVAVVDDGMKLEFSILALQYQATTYLVVPSVL
jgi:hypothetical protein